MDKAIAGFALLAISCSDTPTHTVGQPVGAECGIDDDCASPGATRCCLETTCGGFKRTNPTAGICVIACASTDACTTDSACASDETCCILDHGGCSLTEGSNDACTCVAN